MKRIPYLLVICILGVASTARAGVKEELVRLYTVDRMTDSQIGAHYGVSDTLIVRLRQHFDIQTLSVTDRQKLRNGVSHCDLDEPTLRRLYLQEHLTLNQIGVLYGCSKVPIIKKMRSYGIASISKAQRKSLRVCYA